jgi:hypothetical protein
MDSYAISEDYDYFEVSLDSEDFSDTNTSGFTPQNWPVFEIGGARTLVNVVGMKIISAEIPFSYYIVNSSNNVFQLEEFGADAGPFDITITAGNYTSSQMITELQTELDGSLGAGVYAITYSSSTNKFSITAAGVTTFQLIFGTAGDTTNTDLHWFLGFNSGINLSDGTPILVSPNSINLSGPNYLYVNSQKWGQLTNNLLPQGAENLGGGNRGPQIAKIPINVGPNEIILYDDPAPEYWFNVGFIDALQNIDFYLTLGNFKDVIDLNGLSFCLKFGVLKKKASIDQTSQGGVQNGRVVKRARPN